MALESNALCTSRTGRGRNPKPDTGTELSGAAGPGINCAKELDRLAGSLVFFFFGLFL